MSRDEYAQRIAELEADTERDNRRAGRAERFYGRFPRLSTTPEFEDIMFGDGDDDPEVVEGSGIRHSEFWVYKRRDSGNF